MYLLVVLYQQIYDLFHIDRGFPSSQGSGANEICGIVRVASHNGQSWDHRARRSPLAAGLPSTCDRLNLNCQRRRRNRLRREYRRVSLC